MYLCPYRLKQLGRSLTKRGEAVCDRGDQVGEKDSQVGVLFLDRVPADLQVGLVCQVNEQGGFSVSCII